MALFGPILGVSHCSPGGIIVLKPDPIWRVPKWTTPKWSGFRMIMGTTPVSPGPKGGTIIVLKPDGSPGQAIWGDYP